MKDLNYSICFLAAMLLIGCSVEVHRGPWWHNVEYLQDERTGLCFARYSPDYRAVGLTQVECSEKVKKLLTQKQEYIGHL